MFATVLTVPNCAICAKCGYVMSQAKPMQRRERFAIMECCNRRCVMHAKRVRLPLVGTKCRRVA